ncbi:hypothetical protein RJ639_022495 [Escallonia herrerae]|nr:hypothetical protein RJ639_022495 [Escallonia herrerae]
MPLPESLDEGVTAVTAAVMKPQRPLAGRATYISGEILASVPDPGAVAAASWFRAAALAVKEKCQAS